MIVTVTPNPTIDRTIRVDRLRVGALNRAHTAMSEAGGKGVNVSRALATEGVATLAVVPLGPQAVVRYLALLGETVQLSVVPIDGDIRVNTTVIDADGMMTKVNEPGPEISLKDADAIVSAAAAATRTGWIVGCGSLPPGAPRDLYARLARLATAERRVAIDASGDALAQAVAAGVALIKPNRDELCELVGHPLDTLGGVLAAARELAARRVAVLVSLGADGALYVDSERTVHAEARIADAANPVGAGDALLAGFLAAGARHDSLAIAVAWAVASVRSPGTRMHAVTEADRAAVTVHARIDTDRRLAP